MSKLLIYTTLTAAAVSTLAAPTSLRAQSANVAGALYGQGVEAYFAGQLADADSYFSRAISLDATDPRAYYFRAMTRLRDGRDEQARMDMQSGADMEAKQPNRFAVGKALERVQGSGRLLLERYRDVSRMSQAVKTIQPSPLQAPDTGVLRERRVVPLDELMQPGVPRAVAVPETPPPNPAPLGEPAGKPPGTENATTPPAFIPPATTPAAPKAAAPADDESPFGDTSSPEMPAKAAAPKATPKIPPQSKSGTPTPPQPKSTPPAEKPAADDASPFL